MPNLSMNSGVEMLHHFGSMSDIFKHTSASIICVIFLFIFCGDTRANETHNQFQFNCSEQGGLVIPNTGETFFSDYDGVEFQPSFSKTGILLKSDVGNYAINLQSGDLLYGDDLSSDDVAESCEILRRPD